MIKRILGTLAIILLFTILAYIGFSIWVSMVDWRIEKHETKVHALSAPRPSTSD